MVTVAIAAATRLEFHRRFPSISGSNAAAARITKHDNKRTNARSRKMIRGIKFASVPVTDQDRSLLFYTEKLGFKVVTDQPFNDEQRWIELKAPGGDSHLVLFTPDEHRDRIGTFSNIAFYADDVQKTYEELSAKGVEFVQPPSTQDWGTSAVFRDIDGNVFVLSSK
jgi:catechol 2,3-dioxygenase-like lactoylglutathione lyase family enzyme